MRRLFRNRIISIVLSIIMVMGLFPVAALSAERGSAALDEVSLSTMSVAAARAANGVTRIFGADRYATSFKAADTLKEVLGVSKFRNIIVASGTGFADALAGSYLAAVKNAPILLVRGANVGEVKTYIKNNLTVGGTVYLLGGVNAVPKDMESGLDNFNVKRLGGENRYDTNLVILKEAGVGNKDIIVCTGLNFADSLSASASGLPILLVKDGLYASQKEFLKSNGGSFIIVGGTSAVSGTVESQLKAYGSVKRLAGNTRYDTSVLVAKEFFDAPSAAVLAYAQNFPDGLSGGPLAYALKAPLILTDSNKPTAAVNYATGLGIRNGYVLGGTGLISDKVVNNIFSIGAGNQPETEVTLSIDRDYIEMDTGDTVSITATYSGASGKPSWSSSDTSVAAVSDGKVTAKGDGVAIITASYGGKDAKCVISVSTRIEETEPELGPAVSVSKSGNNGSWEIGCVGNTLSFNAVAKTADGLNRDVIASSSNTEVATVSCSMNGSIAYAKVSFRSVGSVTITLTSDDGNASTSFTIDVREYTPQNVYSPESFAAACNYVVGMNDRKVYATGSYTVATLHDYELTWSYAVGSGQSVARRSWSNGHDGAAITYEGLNEDGLHVFYCHS